MRITGGQAGGIPLKTGDYSGVRPATDRLRESVFSSLGGRVEGVRFLDLFAGSGAYGLEAWSRGAAGGVFVEKHRRMAQVLMGNARAVSRSLNQTEEAVEVITADVIRWEPRHLERTGLIFIDPPYELIPNLGPDLFGRLGDWLAPDGIVVFEMPGGLDLAPPGWECFRRLGKGRHQPGCGLFRRTS